MRPSFLLLSFALVVVSHGDPTALDDDDRPTDDTSTPAPTTNSTDDNTTLTAASLEQTDETDDETDDGPKRNRLFPKMPKCENFDLPCSILVFSVALVCFLAALACAMCYAMHNKRQQRQKLVPCDAYCTCPAHANHSSHFATRLESA